MLRLVNRDVAMRIVIISNTVEYLRDVEYIRNYILERVKDVDVHIICGGFRSRDFIAKPGVHYVYQDFQNFLETHRHTTIDNIVSLQRSQASIIPSSSYKSDRRYIQGLARERDLVLEQIYLVETVKGLFQDIQPHLLFTTDGASIIKTVPFHVGQNLGVRCYRMYPEYYLNPYGGVRFWFTPNNYRRLSDDSDDQFGYPADITQKHAADFLSSVLGGTYKLDGMARSMGREKLRFGVKNVMHLGENALRLRFSQLRREMRPVIDRILNDRLATAPASLPKPYFLFPLNWPEDAQLVARAPQYQDALSVTEQIANVLPYGHSLVIKEHPGYPGMLEHYRLRAVLRAHSNIVYVSGKVRLQQLLQNASALITVNSTAAIEALLHNIPVITLGEAFYRDTGLTYDVGYLFQLSQLLSTVIAEKRDAKATHDLLHSVICQVLQQTVPEPGKNVKIEDRLDILGDGIVRKANKLSYGATRRKYSLRP